ncbi:MAG TPA: membrane protein insertase YidC [Actinophytocola sp.]|uniref:YidC/Oxa1 family membrane protein insertase n=1 Tax=Actinophytocola sp. TaxID=1872138 RepID=UPI002DBA061E|nr:membrane protein insertase YidC [Actinophytocola sp.]HEU5471665.1 membrane protein insertase YidC [Actinophytocola sp.]
MFALFDVPVAGAYHVLLAIVDVLGPVPAILVFTVAVRLLLHPLARAAARGDRVRQELAPRMAELKRKYGKDPDRMRREVARLHQESGGSMFAGCLPLLAQLPFFFVMFRLFSTGTVAGGPNALLGHTLFGTPLAAHASAAHPVFLLLFAVLAALAWWSTRLLPKEAPAALRLVPYGSVLGAAVLPLAAGIYLCTSTAWGVAERAYLRR